LGVSSGKVSEDGKGGEKGGIKLSGLYKLGAGSCLCEALGVGGVQVLDVTSSAGLRGRMTSGVSSLTNFCVGGCALANSSGSRRVRPFSECSPDAVEVEYCVISDCRNRISTSGVSFRDQTEYAVDTDVLLGSSSPGKSGLSMSGVSVFAVSSGD
jgi:hypothetical protein